MRETDTMTEQVVEDPKTEREDATVGSIIPGIKDTEEQLAERRLCLRICAISSFVIFLLLLGTGLSEVVQLEQAGVITAFQAWGLAEFFVAVESTSVLMTICMGLMFFITLFTLYARPRWFSRPPNTIGGEHEGQPATSPQQDRAVGHSAPATHETGNDI